MATIFDDATKTFRDDLKSSDVFGDVTKALNPTMPEAVPFKDVTMDPGQIEFKGQTVATGIVREMTQAEKDARDNDPSALAAEKDRRCAEIDAKTEALAEAGAFVYDGKNFGMGANDRDDWTGLATAHSIGLVSFPVGVSTKEGDEYSIPDATAFVTWWGTGLATYKGIKDAGRALRTSIKGAADRAAVDAVVDNR